jgi:hypothetical protein
MSNTSSHTHSLTVDELRLISAVVNRGPILALPVDASDPISEEQVRASLAAAERSLRLRDLVRTDAENALRVREDVLASVVICAAAQRIVTLNRVDGQSRADSLNLYLSDEDAVAMTFPENGLRMLTRLRDAASVRWIIRESCLRDNSLAAQTGALVAADSAIAAAREAIRTGDHAAANAALTSAGDQAATTAFVSALAGPHTVCAIHAILPGKDQVRIREFTVLDGTTAWLMTRVDDTRRRIQPVRPSDVDALIGDVLS